MSSFYNCQFWGGAIISGLKSLLYAASVMPIARGDAKPKGDGDLC